MGSPARAERLPAEPMMTLRAAAKRLKTNVYGVLKLIATGDLDAQKVLNAAGDTMIQVSVSSVESRLALQEAGQAPVVEAVSL